MTQPPRPPEEREARANCARRDRLLAQFLVSWRKTVVDVRTLRAGGVLWIGSAPDDLKIPGAKAPRWPLAEHLGPYVRLRVPGEASVRSHPVAGPRPVRGSDVAPSSLDGQDADVHEMFAGDHLTIDLGDFRIAVNLLTGRAESRELIEKPLGFLCALAVTAAVGLASTHLVPTRGLTHQEASEDHSRYIRMASYLETIAEPEPELPPLDSSTPSHHWPVLGANLKCGSDAPGIRIAASEGRWAADGPRDTPDPHFSSEAGETSSTGQASAERSSEALAAPSKAPLRPWGRATSQGMNEVSAQGEMWHDEPGDSPGDLGWGEVRVSSGQSKRLLVKPALSDTAGPRPRIIHTDLAVSGLQPTAVLRAIAPRFHEFHGCYGKALEQDPTWSGRVTVALEVSTQGLPTAVRLTSGETMKASFAECLQDAFAQLVFEPPPATAQVRYPLEFIPPTGNQHLLTRMQSNAQVVVRRTHQPNCEAATPSCNP